MASQVRVRAPSSSILSTIFILTAVPTRAPNRVLVSLDTTRRTAHCLPIQIYDVDKILLLLLLFVGHFISVVVVVVSDP